MAEMGWTARVATAAGAAAGTGAAQLGLGYGLGVVVWPVTDTPDNSVWLGSLGWATWITASATVLGAVLASRIGGGPASPRPADPSEMPTSSGAASVGRMAGPWRLALAASAAIGAFVAVALIALPARTAVRADTFSPQAIAAGYALLGVLLGLVVAYWAVVSRAVATNLITTGIWLWALAISAVVVDLTAHRPSATYLTSWQFTGGTDHLYGTIFWPSAVLTLAAAFVIGVFSVIPATRRGHHGTGVATSGAVGPLLVAAAFFALAPQLTGALGPLESAYLIAPYAVLAGLAGSAVTVAFAKSITTRRRSAFTTPGRPTRPATPARPLAPALDPAPADERDAADQAETANASPERKRGRGPIRPAKQSRAAEEGQTADGSRANRRNRGNGRDTMDDDPSQPAADPVATVPAADPATFPSTPPPAKRWAFWGRRQPKVPVPATPAEHRSETGEPDQAAGAAPTPGLAAGPAAKPAAPVQAPPTAPSKAAPSKAKTPSGTPSDSKENLVKPSTAPSGPSPTPTAPTTAPAQTNPTPSQARPAPGPSGTATSPSSTGASPSGTATSSSSTGASPNRTAPGPSSTAPGQRNPAATSSSRPSPRPRAAGDASSATTRPGTADPPVPASPPTHDERAQDERTQDERTQDQRPEAADPEIAAAARPRGRAKKAAPKPQNPPEDDKSPQSTVTPPPASPTIARINPKPPTA